MGWGDMQGLTGYLVRNRLVSERNAKFRGMWVTKSVASQRNCPDWIPESGRVRYVEVVERDPNGSPLPERQPRCPPASIARALKMDR